MSSDVVAFRFPEGTQFRTSTEPPRVGDVLRDAGRAWVVVAVGADDHGQTSVVLQPVPAQEPADSPIRAGSQRLARLAEQSEVLRRASAELKAQSAALRSNGNAPNE